MPQVVDRDVVFLQQKPGGKNGRVSQGKFPIVEFFGWVNQVADDQCLWGEYHPRKWTNVIWKGTISEGKLVFQPAILRVVVSFCFEMRFHPSKLGKWSNVTSAYLSTGLVRNHQLYRYVSFPGEFFRSVLMVWWNWFDLGGSKWKLPHRVSWNSYVKVIHRVWVSENYPPWN